VRILVAEDDPVSRYLLEAFLVKWGYEVIVAADGVEAWQALQHDNAPQLALLDWMMPGMDGVEICRRVRKRAAEPYTYILLVTAKGQKQDILEGLEAGADDYLTKPFDPQELRARLRVGRRILELQEQLIQAREELRAQATHDPLTGLWNRAAILETLQRELARAERQRTPVAIIMADVDHFKQINDAYGHLAGDAVLGEVSQRMRAAIRSYDAIGRYGGEEFLIVTSGCDVTIALKLAERVRSCVSREPINIAGGTFPATLSLGVAASSEAGDADQLVRAADAALYRAKNSGRNRVELALP
jgi:diguanylate cyclase (GGDEF)-like protein